MTCINCTAPAKFVFSAPGTPDQTYCGQHLPKVYRGSEYVALAPEPVEEAPVEEAVDLSEDDPNPELAVEKPKRTRTRRSPAER